MTHRVPRVGDAAPEMAGLWDGAAWREAPTMAIDRFHGRSSDHRPAVHAKLLHDARALFALFVVEDRWVRCRHTEYKTATPTRTAAWRCSSSPPAASATSRSR